MFLAHMLLCVAAYPVMLPVMLLDIPVMLPVMLLAIPVMLLAIPVMLLAIPVMLPVMFSANTPVPTIGTSNILKANVIANDKIKILAIFIRNNLTLFKYFLETS
jgi:hypothetical protein